MSQASEKEGRREEITEVFQTHKCGLPFTHTGNPHETKLIVITEEGISLSCARRGKKKPASTTTECSNETKAHQSPKTSGPPPAPGTLATYQHTHPASFSQWEPLSPRAGLMPGPAQGQR